VRVIERDTVVVRVYSSRSEDADSVHDDDAACKPPLLLFRFRTELEGENDLREAEAPSVTLSVVDNSRADFVKRWCFEGDEDSVIVAHADPEAEGVAATVSELRGRERVIVLVSSCDEDSVSPSNVRECDNVTEALPWPIDKDRVAVRDDVPEPSVGLTSLENS
jgi:hypothetical protein